MLCNVEIFVEIIESSMELPCWLTSLVKKKRFNQSNHLKCFMVAQCSFITETAKKNQDIALASGGGCNTDFNLNNIIATLCRLFLR